MADEESESASGVLREVNDAHGTTYTVTRRLPGGFQSGAWLVLDEAGNAAVLKWTPAGPWADQVQRASRAVLAVRRQGYPTPAWRAVGVTRSGHGYQVQDFVPGSPLEQLTVSTAHSAIDLLELQTDLDPDPDRSWSTFVTDWFRDEWTSTTRVVAASGPNGAELVSTCVELLSRHPFPVLPSADLVHGDFRLGNILFDHGRVSGVIDIEALGSGTRVFDYATLLDHEQADDAAIELLVEAGVDVAGPAALTYCLVHVVLDLALFVQRRVATGDRPEVDRRARSLSARAQLVGQLLR